MSVIGEKRWLARLWLYIGQSPFSAGPREDCAAITTLKAMTASVALVRVLSCMARSIADGHWRDCRRERTRAWKAIGSIAGPGSEDQAGELR